jgi:4-hydroxy-tetrahydrodipicolinate reductase
MQRRVGVFGAAGRMGRMVCAAVAGDPALELVAAIDPFAAGTVVEGCTVVAEAGQANPFDVAIDFTVADAARANLAWCAASGVHAVVGTTGLSDADLDVFRTSFTRSNCLVAANFAIGAVLMMRFAELAAPFFATAEIIEFHHDAKVDAPSGTATTTAARMARASADWAPDPTRHEVLPGARGGVGPAGIRVHGVRMRGMFAHQEVVLGTEGQTLTIRHDTFGRDCYAPGILLACKRIDGLPGLTVGLDGVLGL